MTRFPGRKRGGFLGSFFVTWKSLLPVKLIQVVCIITSCSAKGILRRFLNVARTEINSGCINLWEISQQSTCDMFEKRYSWRFLREVGEYPLPPLYIVLAIGWKSLTKHPNIFDREPKNWWFVDCRYRCFFLFKRAFSGSMLVWAGLYTKYLYNVYNPVSI